MLREIAVVAAISALVLIAACFSDLRFPEFDCRYDWIVQITAPPKKC